MYVIITIGLGAITMKYDMHPTNIMQYQFS